VILLDFLRRRAEVIDDAAAKENVLKSSALPREVSTTAGSEPPRTDEVRRARTNEDR
jgi:hypothetical protein